jgi:lysophospholipase L1-like esterase
VHKCFQGYSSEFDGEENYYKTTKEICEKWGVPYLDLNTLCPPIGAGGIEELRTAYTYNGDGWHPTEAGYKAYYVPKIEAWLKTL